MKFQQIIFALSRIIQVLISLEYTLFNIIPKSLVTLQFLIFQIKAYIQGFQMRYQSFLGHWYPNSYSWFSDSIDIPFVLITTVSFLIRTNICIASLFYLIKHVSSCFVTWTNRMWKSANWKTSCSALDTNDPKMIDTSFESPKCRL